MPDRTALTMFLDAAARSELSTSACRHGGARPATRSRFSGHDSPDTDAPGRRARSARRTANAGNEPGRSASPTGCSPGTGRTGETRTPQPRSAGPYPDQPAPTPPETPDRRSNPSGSAPGRSRSPHRLLMLDPDRLRVQSPPQQRRPILQPRRRQRARRPESLSLERRLASATSAAVHRDPGSRAVASACLRVPCGYRDQTHVVEEKILIIDPDHSGRETPGADVPPRL